MEFYYYLLVLGVIGSFVQFSKQETKGFKSFFVRLVDGCFSAFIVYEIAFYYLSNERISLAICGIGAWLGTENIISYVRDFLNKGKK